MKENIILNIKKKNIELNLEKRKIWATITPPKEKSTQSNQLIFAKNLYEGIPFTTHLEYNFNK